MIAPAKELPVLDYSAASTLHACSRKFQYQYEQGLRPKGGDPAYLHGGSAFHEALHSLYTLRWDLGAAMDALRAGWGDFITPRVGKHAYLTLGHLELVLERYFEDRTQNPTALEKGAIEGAERLHAEDAIVFDWPGKDGRLLRVGGKIDLPTMLAGERFIVDHKTTTSWLNNWWFAERFTLGHQFRVYGAAMKALTGETYSGAYVNGIYIGEKATDPPEAWKKRQSVPNSLFGPISFSEEMLEETWDWMDSAHALKEMHESRGHWPQNEAACGLYGGCQFKVLCERTPKVRSAIARMEFDVVRNTGVLLSGADGTERVKNNPEPK